MKTMRIATLFLITILVGSANLVASEYEINPDSIYAHIAVLAHDSLEGRMIGEPGEWKAAQYIKKVFEQAGLDPAGDDSGWMQACDFVKQIDLGGKNRLTVNGVDLKLREEFLPMEYSSSGEFDFSEVVWVDYGIKVGDEDGDYNDYEGKDVEGKAVLIMRKSPSSDDNPHIDFDKYSTFVNKINTALAAGATGVFFITPEDHDDTLLSTGPVRINPKDIPVVLLRRKGLQRLGLSLSHPDIRTVVGATELIKTRDTGYNVVGYLPAASDTTVIIGAHYDHLGWGTSSSLYVGEEPMVHNGADDNGSGTSLLLELARYYSSRREKLHYSLLFIAFTGEEAGLIGSSTFARNMTIDSSKVRMMINMDMVGRMRDQDNGLVVFGTGTCPEFSTYFDSLSYDDINIVAKESGTGPSDHTAFYNRHIPVLFYFTGAHSDYHKPSDDVDLIDLDGTVRVGQVVRDAIDYFDRYQGQLVYQKTKDDENARRRSAYSVTLGIMPDYIAEVDGLKVDGVTPDRPGDRAGLLEGDIVIKMGQFDIGDIYDYMNCLGKFRKGDTTIVVVNRSGTNVELQVIFE